jgi:hypothetical protein
MYAGRRFWLQLHARRAPYLGIDRLERREKVDTRDIGGTVPVF